MTKIKNSAHCKEGMVCLDGFLIVTGEQWSSITEEYIRLWIHTQLGARDAQPHCYTVSHAQVVCDMCSKVARHNRPASNLLAELLQVGDHAVTQAILHVVSQQVWCSHDSERLSQGLWKEHSNKTGAASLVVFAWQSNGEKKH